MNQFSEVLIEKKDQINRDDQIVNMFLATVGSRSVHTFRNYNRAILQFRQFINYKDLEQVTWKDIQIYKISLERGYLNKNKAPLLPSTVASLIAPLRSLYKWGSDPNINLLPHNPTTVIHHPHIPVRSQHHYLTKKEVSLFLFELKRQSERNYLIGLTLVLTGIRVSELVSIQWNHFYTDATESKMWLTIVNGKGKKQREIKIPKKLWDSLEKYKRKMQADLKSKYHSGLKMFPISCRQVQRLIKKTRENINLKKSITPHWLRHTNATLALIHGATLQQVQKTLGHSKINTTQRYLHTVEQLEKAAPDYVEDSLIEFI